VSEGNGTRVTNAQLDAKLNDFRREVKLWVALGLVGGQTLAGIVTAVVTRMGPVEQAQAVAHVVAAHLF
jgi:hypothetical protein